MEEIIRRAMEAMDATLKTPEEKEHYRQHLQEHMLLVGKDGYLSTEERAQAMAKMNEPTPEPRQMEFNSWLAAQRRKRQAEAPAREAAFRQQATPLCQKYNLSLQEDRTKLKAIISALERQETCKTCRGNCTLEARAYKIPKITSAGEVIWQICPVELNRLAKKKLPPKYAQCSLANYTIDESNRQAVKLGLQFLQDGKHSLYYWGGVGTGKTFLATLLGKEYLRGGNGLIFGDVPGLLDEIKITFNDPTVSSQSVLRKFIHCDLLILDDIGVGEFTKWNVGILYQIINGRYNAQKPMILTSNYSLDELASKMKKVKEVDAVSVDRLTDRLTEICSFSYLGARSRRRKDGNATVAAVRQDEVRRGITQADSSGGNKVVWL